MISVPFCAKSAANLTCENIYKFAVKLFIIKQQEKTQPNKQKLKKIINIYGKSQLIQL